MSVIINPVTLAGNAITIVQEDNTDVVNPAGVLDFIEPDATLVTNSPAGTARVDMSQYALLAGRAAGQTLNGAVDASSFPQLTLNATSSATTTGSIRSILLDGSGSTIVLDSSQGILMLNLSNYSLLATSGGVLWGMLICGPTLTIQDDTNGIALDIFANIMSIENDTNDRSIGEYVNTDSDIHINAFNGKTLTLQSSKVIKDETTFTTDNTANSHVTCVEHTSLWSQPDFVIAEEFSGEINTRRGLWYMSPIFANLFGQIANVGHIDTTIAVDIDDQIQITTLCAGVRSAITPAAINFFLLDTGGAQNQLIGVTTFGFLGTQTGTIKFKGITSGVVTLNPVDATGTWTFTLPPGAGSASQVLTTDGTGITSWSDKTLLAYVAKTSNYIVILSDYTIDCIANSFTVTLLTAVGIQGRVFNIKNSGTGTITLATTSSQTIDGQASGAILLGQYDNIEVQSNGANWIIL